MIFVTVTNEDGVVLSVREIAVVAELPSLEAELQTLVEQEMQDEEEYGT